RGRELSLAASAQMDGAKARTVHSPPDNIWQVISGSCKPSPPSPHRLARPPPSSPSTAWPVHQRSPSSKQSFFSLPMHGRLRSWVFGPLRRHRAEPEKRDKTLKR